MRSFLCAMLLGLGVLAAAPPKAEAQWRPRVGVSLEFGAPYRPYYGYNSYPYRSYYYGGYPRYDPYYWSGRYNYSPYGRSYYYNAYSPWTNQYRYNYYYSPYGW